MIGMKINGKTLVAAAVVSGWLFAMAMATGPAFADKGNGFEAEDGSAVSTLVQSKEDAVEASSGLVAAGETVISRSGVLYREGIKQKVVATEWGHGLTLLTASCSGEPGTVVKVQRNDVPEDVWKPIGIVSDVPVPHYKAEIAGALGVEVDTGGWANSLLVPLALSDAQSWLPKVHSALPKCGVGEKFDGTTLDTSEESSNEEFSGHKSSKPKKVLTDEEREELPVWVK